MTPAEELEQLLKQAAAALRKAGILPEDLAAEIRLERPGNPEHGDFSTNLPLTMARLAGMAPRKLAEELLARLPASDLVKGAEVAGPGFINFHLSEQWLQTTVINIEHAREQYGRRRLPAAQKIQIEFVSANPTGPLHVGSGRNAAYGDALGRLLEAAGYEVEREFYVNDAGNQIHRFTASLRARYLEALGREAEFPEGGYEGDYLIRLGKELAAEEGDRLVDHPDEIRRYGLERVLSEHRRTLERFGVQFDSWFSEQSLHKSGKVDATLEKLRLAGHLYEQDGATWFRATSLGAPRDQVLVRSGEDRAPTYLGVDAAYLLDKLERGFDRVVYVWGADHHGNVAGLRAVAKALGVEDRLEVLLHQMVHFQSVRMSRRLGTIVTLDELLDEVGPDAARFTFLSRSIDMTIDFDMQVAKAESPENPVYYVQYQHARACSVLRLAEQEGILRETAAAHPPALLTNESETELLKRLAEYPDLVGESAALRAPHRLTHFAQATASAFSAFYRDCRVLSDDRELTAERLRLVDASRQVLANCLGLLGVSAPERMEPRPPQNNSNA